MVIPRFMALESTLIISSLLILGSLTWLMHAFKHQLYAWAEWLKPLTLIAIAFLVMSYPTNGISAIGFSLVIYLFLDAVGSFIFAYLVRPAAGWSSMVFNGVASLILATLFLIGWPESSLVIVGLYISISLFFDGWALLIMGWMQRKLNTVN